MEIRINERGEFDDSNFCKYDVQKCFAHSFLLFRRLLADTRAAAQGAINASRAYANIIKYVDQADNASTSALDAAVEALNLVRSEILAGCFSV